MYALKLSYLCEENDPFEDFQFQKMRKSPVFPPPPQKKKAVEEITCNLAY